MLSSSPLSARAPGTAGTRRTSERSATAWTSASAEPAGPSRGRRTGGSLLETALLLPWAWPAPPAPPAGGGRGRPEAGAASRAAASGLGLCGPAAPPLRGPPGYSKGSPPTGGGGGGRELKTWRAQPLDPSGERGCLLLQAGAPPLGIQAVRSRVWHPAALLREDRSVRAGLFARGGGSGPTASRQLVIGPLVAVPTVISVPSLFLSCLCFFSFFCFCYFRPFFNLLFLFFARRCVAGPPSVLRMGVRITERASAKREPLFFFDFCFFPFSFFPSFVFLFFSAVLAILASGTCSLSQFSPDSVACSSLPCACRITENTHSDG